MDTRSPLDKMIDEACGFKPVKMPDPTVKLLCTKCYRTKMTYFDLDTMPNGTAKIECTCDTCADWNVPYVEKFFDAKGNTLDHITHER